MEIHLYAGKGVALVDNDCGWLTQYVWWLHKAGHVYYARGYVNGKKEYMHRLILPNVALVDHRNRDGLDNRRENLRSATKSQNTLNSRRLKKNTLDYIGVRYRKDLKRNKWVSEVCRDGQRYYLGTFATAEDANTARVAFLESRASLEICIHSSAAQTERQPTK